MFMTREVGLDCSRGMERTVQVLAAHCVLKQSADIVWPWPPGHHASNCPLNRQGTAAPALPHACFSKGYSSTAPCTPLQHLWGSKTHTQVCLHTHTHTYTHTHTHTQMHARIYTGAYTHIHMRRHSHTGTYVCTHTNTHTHTHTYTHSHAHMHMNAHVARVMGFANISASLATLPHLSLAPSSVDMHCLKSRYAWQLRLAKLIVWGA